MIWKPIVGTLIGSIIGGVIGYYGSCSTGTCPLTSSPWGGAIFGGIMGLTITLPY